MLYKAIEISNNGESKMTLFVRINPQLEKEFRIKVAEKFGGQKGALQKALEEAIKDWVKKKA